jgi:hypothetical protein
VVAIVLFRERSAITPYLGPDDIRRPGIGLGPKYFKSDKFFPLLSREFKMTSKARLITAQGPAQLINVLGILNYQSQNETIDDWEDHLVLGGFCTDGSDETTKLMIETCTEISKYWKFKSIEYLSPQNLLLDNSFSETIERVERKLSLKDIQSIYVCRNWQLFNEILLEIYKDSTKVCYGDSFGALDLNDDRSQPKPYNPKGYSKIDKTYLFMPMECDRQGKAFSLAGEMIQPPVEYLVATINSIGKAIPSLAEYTKSINSINSQKLTLVTTSNLTESGLIRRTNKFDVLIFPKLFVKLGLLKLLNLTNKFLNLFGLNASDKYIKSSIDNIYKLYASTYCKVEVDMYFQQIREISREDEVLIIKPHPRETLNQSLWLHDKLSRKGYHVIVIDKFFSCFPVELFLTCINFSKVISLNSSSAIMARFLLNISDDAIYPFLDKSIRRKYLSKIYIDDEECYHNLYDQARMRKFSPIRGRLKSRTVSKKAHTV